MKSKRKCDPSESYKQHFISSNQSCFHYFSAGKAFNKFQYFIDIYKYPFAVIGVNSILFPSLFLLLMPFCWKTQFLLLYSPHHKLIITLFNYQRHQQPHKRLWHPFTVILNWIIRSDSSWYGSTASPMSVAFAMLINKKLKHDTECWQKPIGLANQKVKVQHTSHRHVGVYWVFC